MKNILTIVMCLAISLSAFANHEKATIIIKTSGQDNIELKFDGKEQKSNNNEYVFQNIEDGKHYITIHKIIQTGYNQPTKKQLIYKGNLSAYKGMSTTYHLDKNVMRTGERKAYPKPNNSNQHGSQHGWNNGHQPMQSGGSHHGNFGWNNNGHPHHGNGHHNNNSCNNGYSGYQHQCSNQCHSGNHHYGNYGQQNYCNHYNQYGHCGTSQCSYSGCQSSNSYWNWNNGYQHYNGYNYNNWNNGYPNNQQGNYYNNPHQNNAWNNYNQPISNQNFKRLMDQIQDEFTDNSKIDVIKLAFNQQHITAQQVRVLLEELTFDSNKLEIAKFLYGKTVNQQDYFLVSDAFTFNSNKKALSDFIAR